MIFSSSIFLFYFFPIFLFAYFITPVAQKNKTALAGSLLFYMWGAPKFGFLLIASIVLDFYLGNKIYQSSEKRKKKWFLSISIILNLGLLAYFKYANFFVENENAILNGIGIEAVSWTNVVLPIGISFFTF